MHTHTMHCTHVHTCTHTYSHTHVQTHSGLSETPASPVWVVDSPVHAQASEKGYGRVWGMGRTQPARCQVWELGSILKA